MYIYYTSWEMNCCGEPFCVNDIIELEVVDFSKIEENQIKLKDITINLDYLYDGHYSYNANNRYKIKGKVSQIYIDYAEINNSKCPITKLLKPTNCAKGFESKVDNLTYEGYVIKLENTTITKIPFNEEKAKYL